MWNQRKRLLEIKDWEKVSAIERYAILKANGYEGAELLHVQNRIITDIMLKRQKIQADAMSALDEKTNEMLIKNAQNTVEQSKMITRMASSSSIKIETLETTWRTIVSGIDETRQIQEQAKQQRIADQAKLENIKAEFNRTYSMPGKK